MKIFKNLFSRTTILHFVLSTKSFQYNKLYFKFVHLSYDPWSKSRAHSQHNGFILMCSKLKSLKPYPTNGVSEFVDKGYPRNQRTLRNHEY